MKRLDVRLVDEGLAPSRTKAQAMIEAGEVRIDGRVVTQVSSQAAGTIEIQSDSSTLKYVSRGGLKLEAALMHLNLNVKGWRCIDVGQSTGGFTDCLLQKGASAVAGFDVGHGQLHERLRADPRVLGWEGVHIRDWQAHRELQDWLRGGLDLTVVDVSFIGLTNVLPYLPKQGALLTLVKPQFEVGQENLNRRGVVSDNALFDDVRAKVLQDLEKHGFQCADYFPCAVKGQDGNQEFFAFARPRS